jgi:inhibitor of cysteine peptidase
MDTNGREENLTGNRKGMLKIKIILFLGILVASVGSFRGAEPSGGTRVKMLTEEDNGAAVTLTLNSRLMIRLPTQPGTGFSWSPKTVSSVLRLVKSYEETPAQMLPGGIETKVFVFTPVAAGTDQLELDYRRPWEHGGAPAKVFRVTATVR